MVGIFRLPPLWSLTLAIGRFLHQVQFNFVSSSAITALKLKHVIAVSKVSSPLVAVVATDIVKKCVLISLRCHDCDFVCDQTHSRESCTQLFGLSLRMNYCMIL